MLNEHIKQAVLNMRKDKISYRKIGEILDLPKSTVTDQIKFKEKKQVQNSK